MTFNPHEKVKQVQEKIRLSEKALSNSQMSSRSKKSISNSNRSIGSINNSARQHLMKGDLSMQLELGKDGE